MLASLSSYRSRRAAAAAGKKRLLMNGTIPRCISFPLGPWDCRFVLVETTALM